eukprot:2236105-Prymnesium_polylepis.1
MPQQPAPSVVAATRPSPGRVRAPPLRCPPPPPAAAAAAATPPGEARSRWVPSWARVLATTARRPGRSRRASPRAARRRPNRNCSSGWRRRCAGWH